VNSELQTTEKAASGCVGFLVLFVMPIMSIAAACAGLISGATLTFYGERIEPRRVEEVLETRGVVTVPVQRVVESGRVDVTVARRILGLIPMQRITLEDVIDADSSSGTTHVRRTNSSVASSSYDTGNVELVTRAGRTWRSPEIDHAIGPDAAEIEKRVAEFLEHDTPRLTIWSVPWLSNIVGIPFALVALFFIWAWIAKLRQMIVRTGNPPDSESPEPSES